jgi:hypothetical protein
MPSVIRQVRAVLASAAVMIVLVACAGSGPSDATAVSAHPPQPSPSVTTSHSPSPPASATATASASAGSDLLPSGRHLVYLRRLRGDDASGWRLRFDLALWFTGHAAIKAAIEDGVIKPGDVIPNDVYIRNDNPKLRTMTIDSAARVLLLDPNTSQTSRTSLETLANSIREGEDGESPYWLRVRDGVIVKVEEQFLP